MTRLVAHAVIRRAVLAAAGLAALIVLILWRVEHDSGGRPAPAARGSVPAPAEEQRVLTVPDASAERVAVAPEVPPSPLSAPAPAPPPERGAVVLRVVDQDGRSEARVPVALFAQAEPYPAAFPVEQAETDGAGAAVLGADARARKQRAPPDARFFVGIDLPLEPPVRAELGLPMPGPDDPARTVELVLPAGARAWLEPVRVQLVDAAGAPVGGAEVVLRTRLAPKRDDWNQLGEATTRAPDGMAEFPRDRQREQVQLARLMQLSFEYDAALSGPFVPEPHVAVPAQPSSEPVRLVLPPAGAVRARLRAADGTPVAEGASVYLEWYAKGEEKQGGRLSAEAASGVVRFERVGLGLELRLGAWLPRGAAEAPAVALAGPSRDGEEVQVELQLGPPRPVLTGRVVDAEGVPRAGMRFDLRVRPRTSPPPEGEDGRRGGSLVSDTTDAEGRFRAPWLKLPAEPSILCLAEHAPHEGPPPGWIPQMAEVDFPALDAGGTELAAGDLKLRAVPVIAAGRVVDARGAPVNQAWLEVSYPSGAGESEAWHNLDVVGASRVSTDAEGRFAVRTLDAVRALRLAASRKGLGRAPEQDVAPGTLDVELVLEPEEDVAHTCGQVQGSIRFDPDIPLFDVEVYLRGAWGGHDTYPFGGVFLFKDVPPGTHSVVVQTADTHFELLTIEGVEVRAGETADDARLADIDLRGRLRWLRLRLAGEDGKPMADKYVFLRIERESGSVHTDQEGRLAALVRSEDDSFEVTVDGFAPAAVGWSADEQPVRLLRP